MKKYVMSIALMAVTVFALTGCEGKTENENASSEFSSEWSSEIAVHTSDRKMDASVPDDLSESVNDVIAVILEVSHVTPGGLTLHFRQYEKRDTKELFYGEDYILERLEDDAWVEVPRIIDNGGFHDIAYLIPPEGEAKTEINWEWLYGKLTPGTYRITKTVGDGGGDAGDTGMIIYPLKAQFILTEE